MKSGAGDDPFAEPAVQSDPDDGDGAEAEDADSDASVDEEPTTTGDGDRESPDAESEPRTDGTEPDSDSDAGDGEDDGDEGDDGDDGEDGDADETSAESEADASTQEIPYKFRRSSVKEGRTQRPIFVREAVEDRESEFIRTLEDEVGEKVYKTDAMEAALIVAMDNPELVAAELREWGYDWE